MGHRDDEELGEAIARAVGPALGLPSVQVDRLRLLSGGASRETWSFDAVDGDSPDAPRHRLVLQRTRGGLSGMQGPSMEVEDRVLAEAERNGVPVPAVVVPSTGAPADLCTDAEGSARISRHVAGEALGPRLVRDERFASARRLLAEQCGRALAGVHSIDPLAVPGLAEIEPLQRLRQGFDALEVSRPAFEMALRWLARHRPVTRPARVVHGDFRIGNLIVDEDHGLRAVLDWELAHLGDPVEDLGWLCVRSWRFGGSGVVGGVGELEDLLEGYVAGGGDRVDPEEVRWWTVVGTLTWGLICAVQARRHLGGGVRSVELAAIGRRICETEYDVLQLMGVTAAEHAPARTHDGGRPAPDVHGRPSAAELVEAVREHLEQKVAPDLEGSAAFQLKVAANALGVVERELRSGHASAAELRGRLDDLGMADEAELATAIREGRMDGRDDVEGAARATVVDRLAVANPKWLQGPDRPSSTDRP